MKTSTTLIFERRGWSQRENGADAWARLRDQPVGEAARSSVAARTAPAATRSIAILGLVDLQGTAFKVFAVQRLHRARCIRVRHLDEAEPSWTPRITVSDQGDLLDSAVSREQCTHTLFGCREGKVSDVKFCHFITRKRLWKLTALSAASWFAASGVSDIPWLGRATFDMRLEPRQTNRKARTGSHSTLVEALTPEN